MFFLVNNILGIVLPTIIIVILYVRIIKKVWSVQKNLNGGKKSITIFSIFNCKANRVQSREAETIASSTAGSSTAGSSNAATSNQSVSNASTFSQLKKQKRSKQANLTFQFILVNFITILGSVFSIMINVSITVYTFGDKLNSLADINNMKPLFQFFFIFSQTLIPIFSMVLSSSMK